MSLRSLIACALLAAPLARPAPPIPADLRELSRAYQKSGSPADRSELAAAAAKLSAEAVPYGALTLGAGDHDAEDWDAAVAALKSATEGDVLADYAVYLRGRSFAKAEKFAEAAWTLKDFARKFPSSRLAPAAARIRAESLIRENRLPEAREACDPATGLSEPDRFYLLGRILQLDGKLLEAVESYRRAYYFHPLSEQAAAAEERLAELNRSMGPAYPKAPAEWRLARADALFAAARVAQAASEYGRAWPGLQGAERERAQVRQAVANYRRLHTTTAQTLLTKLKPADPDLQAERLYYLGECARRKNRISAFRNYAEQLGREHPKSPWYEEALFSLGNFYLLRNDAVQYRSYYDRAARAFPKGKYADRAHWKVCWRAHLDRDPRARSLFEEHVRLYPSSAQASAALYWLARMAQKEGEDGLALALYRTIDDVYPNYYYGLLARQRMPEVSDAAEPAVHRYSDLLARLPKPRRVSPNASPETVRTIERGRLLFDLGLDDHAERELLTADYRRPDGPVAGLELARQSAARDDHFRAMRHMKRYGYGYLRLPIESMTRPFWESLYPLPYEDRLRERAQPHELDPYLVAGLIRQESEFNPGAVSRAGARGLMQLMPATGKEIARRLGVSGFATRRLHEPDVSLRFGTFHLKQTVQRYDGRLELCLAAYNAGERRADTWIHWGDFHEPAEFVETIPFTETRGYVQSVLRNRDMYRRLYSGETALRSTPTRDQIAAAQ